MPRRLLIATLLTALAGCNQYELFRLSGFAQESFSNDADVLFVIDNSASMQEETLGLANEFDSFIGGLADPDDGGYESQDLSDAVDNYIDHVRRSSRLLDYQLAITTTDVEATYGALHGPTPLVENTDEDVEGAFIEDLLCDATCFTSAADVPSDPTYTCGDDYDTVTREVLDCVCGDSAWLGNCAQGGTEEGLEAVFMAMCRAVEDPPAACFEHNQFDQADVGSNAGLLREGSHLIPVIVTDEGDVSRRLDQGDPGVEAYMNLFRQFGQRISFAVIGPDPDNPSECTELAAGWGVDRYAGVVDETDGLYWNIAEPTGGGCQVTDFAAALSELGSLMNALLDTFPLQGAPDVDTILVFVEKEEVPRAVEEPPGTFTDGWSYDPEANAVVFHGEAIPDYNEDVRIYYRPLSGMPRQLPF